MSNRSIFQTGVGVNCVVKSLPVVNPKRLIRALERAGFYVHRVSGSHYILKHSTKPMLRVTIPYHNRDLKRGTLESIVKQAGLTNKQFLDLI